ncbi:MAG: tetratricopeptide repeat protein [Vicinamibacterales bacterium]
MHSVVRPWICALVIAAAGSWAYANSLTGVFVLDDVRAIVRNESIRTLSPIQIPLSPPGMSTVSGRPLANLTFAVNYAVSALDPHSYHLVNILIHIATAVLFFGVLRRTLLTPELRERFGSSATLIAAASAALWVTHPLTTSAVTYIVQRVESLMALFYLLTLYSAIRAGEAVEARSQRLWTTTAILACGLGMATKEVMVTAPVAVLLWDVVFRRKERPRWGLYAGLAAAWMVFATLRMGEQREASIVMTGNMSWRYLLTQSEVLVRYLRLAVVPSPLIFLYSWPLATSLSDVLLPVLGVAALLALTIFAMLKRHPLGYAGTWFFVVLAPTSSVIPIVTEIAAEHRMYLPLMAVVAASAATTFLLLQRFGTARAARIVAGAALVVSAIFGIQTRDRNSAYGSEEAIWRDTVEKDPANQRAHLAYGSSLGTAGRIAEAEAEFQRAVDLNDADPTAHARLGSAQAALGTFDSAVTHLQRALHINPVDAEANKTLGQIYATRRQDSLAAVHLERAMQARPGDAQVILQLASVLADSREPSVRNPPRALQLAEEAVRLTSRQEATALDVLGLAYARNGRIDDAISAARDALSVAQGAGNAPAIAAIESRLQAYQALRDRASGR